jgi:hypothetical protein
VDAGEKEKCKLLKNISFCMTAPNLQMGQQGILPGFING